VPYEEEVIRNPYNMRSWVRYLEYKEEAPSALRNILYERALRELPGSFKLWYNYLRERKLQVRGLPLNDPAYDSVNNAFERCLQTLHKV
jgi:pre-mRNA-splicing factor SYF1